eukprot:6174479-Pleurochrysis_carterae.AAC.7
MNQGVFCARPSRIVENTAAKLLLTANAKYVNSRYELVRLSIEIAPPRVHANAFLRSRRTANTLGQLNRKSCFDMWYEHTNTREESE